MRKLSKFLALALAGSMVLMSAGCGNSGSSSTQASSDAAGAETENSSEAADSGSGQEGQADAGDGKTYRIGVLQLVQHDALDKANEGFFAALDEAGVNYEADQQNAAGEQSTCQTIAEKLVNDKNDLILAIATPAAQAVANATSDIPILVTAITDPAESGLLESNEAPGVNVSGTSDLTPVKEQIDLLKKLIPDAKKVGILYCSAEANSVLQADMAKEALGAQGLEYEEFTVSTSNEIQAVVESMAGKVDAIYAPTDNMIAAGMDTVSMIANENNLPVICGESGMVKAGGLATYGIDYYQLGYLAGEQAVEILVNGADIAAMPVEYLAADKCELTVNEETAEALGIDLSVIQ